MRDGGLRVQGEAPARAKEKELVAKTARKGGFLLS